MAKTKQPFLLGQLLLSKQVITRHQLKDALAYQKASDCMLGEALVSLGAIDESILRRTLRRQRWLRPCATCFALLSPFSVTYAYDPNDYVLESTLENNNSHWYLNQSNSSNRQATQILSTALDVYQGAPEKGEWRYSVSRTDSKDGYQIQMRLFF